MRVSSCQLVFGIALRDLARHPGQGGPAVLPLLCFLEYAVEGKLTAYECTRGTTAPKSLRAVLGDGTALFRASLFSCSFFEPGQV